MANTYVEALSDQGAGYVTLRETQALGQMSSKQVEKIVKEITGKEYTLMTVNNATDNRKAKPDPRVYTLLLTSTYEKQQAKRLKRKQS